MPEIIPTMKETGLINTGENEKNHEELQNTLF
jgi:hypothetical protein